MLLSNEIAKTVNATIEQLPEELRTAIQMREIEGMSYEDIAKAMDCPIGTVRSTDLQGAGSDSRAVAAVAGHRQRQEW